MISLISKFSGITVVWVDDRIELTENETRTLIEAGAGTLSELAPLDQTWADVLMSGNGAELPDDGLKSFAAAASIFMEVCNEFHANLILSNFREADSHLAASHRIFLLDLLNATKPLGTTSVDDTWKWDFYGAEFVRHHTLSKHRFRFVSRYRSNAGDPVKDILPRYFAEDSEVLSHSLRLEDLSSLRTNFTAFIKQNSLHPAPALNEAIVFACSPNFTHWHNDYLQEQFGPRGKEQIGPQNRCIREWLSLVEVDGLSAKALFRSDKDQINQPDWSVIPVPDAYELKKEVLQAVFLKLGFERRFKCDGTIGQTLRLPTMPGMPFLIAFAGLVWQMDRDETYYGPKGICLSKGGGHVAIVLDSSWKESEKSINSLLTSRSLRRPGRTGVVT